MTQVVKRSELSFSVPYRNDENNPV